MQRPRLASIRHLFVIILALVFGFPKRGALHWQRSTPQTKKKVYAARVQDAAAGRSRAPRTANAMERLHDEF